MYKIIYLPTAEIVNIGRGFGVNLNVAPKCWFETLIEIRDCIYASEFMEAPLFPATPITGDLYHKVPKYHLAVVEFPDV